MAQQSSQGIAVQLILDGGVPHQQQLLGVPLAGANGLLGLGYRRCLQLGNERGGDRLGGGQFPQSMTLLGAQGPPCGGYAGPLQLTAHILLQTVGDRAYRSSHLGDVLNLSIHHDPMGVEQLFHGQDPDFARLLGPQNTDHASGADIQRVNQLLALVGAGRGYSRFRHQTANSFPENRGWPRT